MHQVVSVAEIFLAICQYVHDDDDYPSLAVLARSCRTFYPIAVEVLWRCLENMIPIFRLLPADAWRFKEHSLPFPSNGTIRVYDLQRRLNASDFTAIMQYAPLVKQIGFRRGSRQYSQWLRYETDMIPSRALNALVKSLPAPTLFPSIHTLDWSFRSLHICRQDYDDERAETTWDNACLCIGPQLRKVVVDAMLYDDEDEVSEQSLTNFLTRIGNNCPQLTEIDIKVSPDISDLVFPVTEWVSSLKNRLARLRRLCCNEIPLTESALCHLGGSTTLTELNFALTASAAEYWIGAALQSSIQANFPVLRQLHIFTEDSTALLRFMEHTGFPQAETISVYSLESSDGSGITTLFNSVQLRLSPLKVTDLDIELGDSSEVSQDQEDILARECIVRPHHLHTLLAFRQLRRLHLCGNWSVDYDDALMEQLAVAWPQIEDLGLTSRSYPWGADEVQTSWRSLQSFATHCPRLEKLEIPFMASGYTGPPATTNSPAQPQLPKIDRLKVSWIIIDGPVSEAAAFLEEILPNLKMFDLGEYNDAEQKRRWYNVRKQYYPMFKDYAFPKFVALLYIGGMEHNGARHLGVKCTDSSEVVRGSHMK
ncbi:hypothetical protein POSPLADRAFT_1139742 [Postia placenta MAD-698-R-SB12]|uniref:F-box domain-containing protein n=1 Tax=Postia placenta MAD-698-R-SB12 TaxID=670580 RepID=A0A1X6N3M1_9APHY|nr:hypothetical protein POSPLADRAFT_1139742 [Postia placenta MAD-698-R-SB12]OSX63227.1 hypothetical protein POSPLADRAFT_1139742 [Postia placenta MAD-698-R-SB12]